MAKPKLPESEPLPFTALVRRPQHLQAIGMLTVEITHMERAMSELFGTIMGIHPFLGLSRRGDLLHRQLWNRTNGYREERGPDGSHCIA